MDINEADILQIKKYLQGKLDARAMHELERRAMDDPFFMDALEGFETSGNVDSASVQLNARLQQRLHKPVAKVFTFSRLAIAASIITVLGAGVWILSSKQPVINKAEVSANAQDNTEVSPSPALIEQQITVNKDSLLALNTPKAVIRSPRKKNVYREQVAASDLAVSADETAELASSLTYRDGTLEEVTSRNVQSKTDSVPFNEFVVVTMGKQRKATVAGAIASAPSVAVTKEVKGRVVSAADGEPLPGVTVRAGDIGSVAVTGADGSYTLKLDTPNTNLTYNYIGYQSKKLDVRNGNVLNTVALEPQTSDLNEVVVVGFGSKAPETPGAHPKNGWENYQKYLNANAISPDGKKKTYKVSFTVERDGTLTNFQINKAASDLAGQKAIQLIKNGPEWIGNTKKNEKKVITVQFKEAGN